MFWRNRPFLRILLFFTTGILLAHFRSRGHPLPITRYLLLFLLMTVISGLLVSHVKSFKYSWMTGLILDMALFLAGFTLTVQQIRRHSFRLNESTQAVWVGKLVTEPVQKAKTVKFVVKIFKQADINSILKTGVKILAYLKTSTLPEGLHLGDAIVFHGKMEPVKAPANPEEFDYRQFLSDRGITYQVYISKKDWKRLPESGGFVLPAVFSHWRNGLLQSLRSQGLNSNEYAVAAAILLGYDQLIAPDLHQDFTTAGAVHILCVSGMHVGIIFLIFSFLLSFLLRFKNGKTLRDILLIFVIWSYALLTGLSPSVSRAATMISLFIAADIFQRNYDNFNILAASAFLLLLLNPLLLFDVGFQLSYAAVTGILMFYFPIYRSVYFSNKILRMAWAALVVSFTAQTGAFALAAHYFHQFPVYFLLTNMAVFVLSYVIIFSGMAFLALSWMPFLNHLLAALLAKTVNLLIVIVHLVARLPQSAVYDLYFPWVQVVMVFILIVCCYYLFIRKNLHMITTGLTVIVLLLGLHTYRHIRLLRQNKFIVYSLRHHTAIDLVAGVKHVLLVDSTAMAQPSKLDYFLKNNRIALGLSTNRHSLTQPLKSGFAYYRKGFGALDSLRFYFPSSGSIRFPSLKHKISVDYLICHAPWKLNLAEIGKAIRFRKIILDGSLSVWASKKLKKQAKILRINYINIKKSGAFIISCPGK